jgi:DNA-binding NtrC family response regulator
MAIGSNSLKSHLAGAPILVAEGEPVARSSLSELFREAGHSVLEAADSDSAIIKMNNKAGLKVIMLDVEMPSWRTVVAHARGTLPAAVILGMSTQDSIRTALDAQRLGIHAYVIKPLVFDDVCEIILRLITGRPLS